MEKNYTILHLHSDLSNATTTMDSVTKYTAYIDRAKELGMSGICFTEHGNNFEWINKKKYCDKNGLKYIHGAEFYITKTIEEKKRDNYHCILIAKNYEGVKEINKLITMSFNRGDGHFYFNPRMSFDELKSTSDNIIISSACFLGGSKIQTLDGLKNIEDVTNLDMVKTIDGTFNKVNYPTSRYYNGDMCEINFKKSITVNLRCTSNHKILKLKGNSIFWEEAKNLNKGDVCLSPVDNVFSNNYSIDIRHISNNDNRCRKRIDLDNIIINKKLMMTFGYWLADGHMRTDGSSVGFTINIKEFDNYYNSFIKDGMSQFGIEPYINKRESSNSVDITYNSVKIYEIFKHIFGQVSSESKKIPNILKNISEEMNSALVYGYLMGDGYFRFRGSGVGGEVVSATISKTLAVDFINILRTLKLSPSIRVSESRIDKNNVNHKESYYTTIHSVELSKILTKDRDCFEDFMNFINNNKNKKNDEFVSINNTMYIKKIVNSNEIFEYSGYVYCLNVNINHNFICEDVVVHNCLGGMLRDNSEVYLEFIDFMKKNKHRCYLEIQPHPCNQQLEYNKKLIKIHNEFNIPILVTTDTHSLNKKLADGRIVLQKAKNIHFESEEEWNTIFMTYDEVLDNFNKQGFEFKDKILEGLNNTNLIKDMVEDFNLDTSFKYPKIYPNPKEEFKKLIKDGIKKRNVKINKKIQETIENEFKVLEKTMQIDYLLLVHRIVDWANSNNIYQGYGRGSICGSWLAYLLGITEMDSLKWNLNFFRYASPVRISIADVDLDWYEKDREKVLDYILKDKMKLNNLKTAKIITFNTINIKGGIRDVGRAFNIPLSEVSYICDNIENNEDELRLKYKELFEYVDILNGVIVSVGSHPAGAVISDKNIEEEFGLCTLSTSDCQVSCVNMKEIDYLGFVKMDILGLDNVGVINETCKSIGIDRLTPDNTPSDDENVWKSISEDATLIFQWESNSSSRYLKGMLSDNLIKRLKEEDGNFSYIDWMSFGNGLIRPACESYRDSILTGDFYDNGLKELNDFLKSTRGRLSMQESIMQFLVEFCGYSGGESDEVRRAIGKKLNTENLVPEIESRFIEYTSKKYNISKEKCKEVIKPFIQVIIDASNYSFSWNHAKPYSWIGYVCGYLRYYYPLQTLTVALNIFYENEEKSNNIVKYIKNKTDIKIKSIRFGKSTSSYNFDKNENVIYKGMSAIKYISKDLGNELSVLYHNKYSSFLELLIGLKNTSINSNQLEILIKLDYFSEFGKSQYLLDIVSIYENFYSRKQISKSDLVKLNITSDVMERFSNKQTEKLYKEIDNEGLVKYLISELDDKDISLKEKLHSQKEYIGYIEYINEKLSDNFYYVLETKFYQSKNKPYLKLYRLKDGNTVDYRINDGFEFNTFKDGDIIKIIKEEKKNKSKLIDGKWVKLEGEFNNFIKSWQVL